MSSRSWLRLGAGAGILHVVLELTGFGISIAGAGAPALPTSTAQEIAAIFANPVAASYWVGLYLQVVAFLLFVPFAARLWATLRAAEGDGAYMAATAFGAGLLFAATSLVSLVFSGVTRFQAGRGIDVHLAAVLAHLNSGMYALTWGVAALFLLTTAAVALRTRALSRLLGWSGVAIAVALLLGMAAPLDELAQLPPFLLIVWIVATSIHLLRQAPQVSPAPHGERIAQHPVHLG